MKLHDAMKRLMALLLTFALMVGMVGTQAMAAEAGSNGGDETTEFVCGKEEHTHMADCYTLTCGLDETEGHTHTEDCYETTTTYACGLEEAEGHTHGDGCYVSELTCTQEEVAGHSHGDDCYDEEGNLVCTLEESEGHTHTEECYSKTLVCELEETEGHVHSEACGTEEIKTLKCELEETAGHSHTEACYTLTCGKEEHTHTEACKPVVSTPWNGAGFDEPGPVDESYGTTTISNGTITVNDTDHTGDGTINISSNATVAVSGTVNCNLVITGGTVTISGNNGTINASGKGTSAITISGANTVVTISDGVTITGGVGKIIGGTNKSDVGYDLENRGTGDYEAKFRAGGGVFVESGKLVLDGGTIDNNTAQRGGGIFINLGAFFTMTSGQVSNNKTVDWDGFQYVNTGEVHDNTNLAGEGGGIFVWGTATISGGKIINNECNSSTDLGGGGLYVNNNGIATLINATVTGNTAQGFGGGIAGCCHGEMSLVATDGVALYGNTAVGNHHTGPKKTNSGSIAETVDHYNTSSKQGINGDNSKDFYTAGSTILSNYMAGGGSANYTARIGTYSGSVKKDGEIYKVETCNPGEDITVIDGTVRKYEKTNIGLVATPSQESKNKVPVGVLIQGNKSNVHGGGIGCNGGLYFGAQTDNNVEDNVFSLSFGVKKTLVGTRSLNADEFRFDLLTSKEKDAKCIASSTNDANGDVTFEVKNYNDVKDLIVDGKLVLYVREVLEATDSEGKAYDKSIYQVTFDIFKTTESHTETLDHTTGQRFEKISVTYTRNTFTATLNSIMLVVNRNGEATSAQKDSVEFVNYEYIPINWQPSVQKNMVTNGHGIPQEQTFTFTLSQDAGDEVKVLPKGWKPVEITVSENGTFTGTFGEIQFIQPGTYHFTVVEDGSSIPNGYTFDDTEYLVTIVVSPNAEAKLSINAMTVEAKRTEGKTSEGQDKYTARATTKYTDPNEISAFAFTFTNTYKPNPTSLDFQVSKTVKDENEIGSVTSTDFTFKLEQLLGTDGHFTSRVTLEEQTMHWDAETKESTVNFTRQDYDKAGTYEYRITEIPGDQKGYTYDEHAWTVVVKVDDINGRLTVTSITYNGEESNNPNDTAIVAFENKYKPKETSFIPSIEKMIEGAPTAKDTIFTFAIKELLAKSEDNKYAMHRIDYIDLLIKAGEANGTASFDAIEYTKPGTYTYEIYEVAPETEEEKAEYPGYTFDNTVWTLTVEVVDNGGELEVKSAEYTVADTSASATDAAPFVNKYEVKATTFAPKVTKKVTGDDRPNRNYTFSFELTAAAATKEQINEGFAVLPENTVATLTYNTNSEVEPESFEDITFKRAGTYTFMIHELSNSRYSGFTYDPDYYEMTVVVEDHDSQLEVTKVTVQNIGNDPEVPNRNLRPDVYEGTKLFDEKANALVTVAFTNTYTTTPTSYSPEVRKVVEGTNPPTVIFSFDIATIGSYGADIDMPRTLRVSIPGNGTAHFGSFRFNKAGTYVFRITEVDGGRPDWIYDGSEWTLTVTVADVDSQLKVTSTSYTAGMNVSSVRAQFTNRYEPTVTPTPTPSQPVTTPAPSSTPAPSNTPAPSATPAPSTVPSEQPTPSTPSQQDYPERNDNPNNPNNPNVPEDQPNMDMPNPDLPLADMPNNPNNPNAPEEEPGMDLPEPDVPLGDAPPVTGETIMTMIWMSLLVVSGAGILITVRNKRREEN